MSETSEKQEEEVRFKKDDLLIMNVNDGDDLLGQLSGYGVEVSVNTKVVKNVQQVKAVAKTLAEAFEQSMLNDLINMAGEGAELKKSLQVSVSPAGEEGSAEDAPVMKAEVVEEDQ